LERAQEYIERAISTVSGFEVPLAAWQVHATAAHIEEELGALESACAHREQSRTTILRLANSLPDQEPLRKIFLSAPAVVRVLHSDAQPLAGNLMLSRAPFPGSAKDSAGNF
jgi:hypothetical protein